MIYAYNVLFVSASAAVLNRSCIQCFVIVNRSLEVSVVIRITRKEASVWNTLNETNTAMLTSLAFLLFPDHLPIYVVVSENEELCVFNKTLAVRNLASNVVHFTLVKAMEFASNTFSKVLICLPKTVKVEKEFLVHFSVTEGFPVNKAGIDFGDRCNTSLEKLSHSGSIRHCYSLDGIYNFTTSMSDSLDRNLSFNKGMQVTISSKKLAFRYLTSSLEPVTGFALSYPNYTTINTATNISYSFTTGVPLTITSTFGDGSSVKMSPKLKSHFYLKYYSRVGIYSWSAKVENDLSPALHYAGVIDVQPVVPHVTFRLRPTVNETCVPVDVFAKAEGSAHCHKCRCLGTIGQSVILRSNVSNLTEFGGFKCEMNVRIFKTGFQIVKLKVYNDISYKEKVHNFTVLPVYTDGGPLRLSFDASPAMKGTATSLRVFGNFLCPLCTCHIQFDDDTVVTRRDLRPNSVLSHMYSTAGSYNIYGVCFTRYHHSSVIATASVEDKIRNFTVVAPTTSEVGAGTVFRIHSDVFGELYLIFKFGDGESLRKNFTLQSESIPINYAYTDAGHFTYSWTVENKVSSLNGSGSIHILYPIKGLKSSPSIVLEWPRSAVLFQLIHNVSYDPPTDAKFMVDFGDGKVSDWFDLSFNKQDTEISLLYHNYTERNCLKTRIVVKNALGYFSFPLEVSILAKIRKVSLELTNVNHIHPAREISAKYLRTEYGIRVEAKVDFDKCVQYHWKLYDNREIFFNTVNKQNIIHINNIIGRVGAYFIQVDITNALSSFTADKAFQLQGSSSGIELLSNKPDGDGVVKFTVLAEKLGEGTLFSWDFGDGHLLNETVTTFQPTARFPDINCLDGAKKLNLSRYQAFVRSHKYLTEGLKTVTIVAWDSFATLKATRTVFLSKDLHVFCSRPQVNILKGGAVSLIFNADESFIILSKVYLRCGNFSKAFFLWELFTSSVYLKGQGRLAESDKQIR